MTEIEGVVKYQLKHLAISNPAEIELTELNAWRTIMLRLELIGQSPSRYGGLGFGNISQRLDNEQFIISGTQTGHLNQLSVNDYCIIKKADPAANMIQSQGPCKPSSEALTHATVYQKNPAITSVIHVHNFEIWNNTGKLNLPCTGKDIAYGTPEMASAVGQLFQQHSFASYKLFTMLGHEDGVVSFGKNLQEAATDLISCLAVALSIEKKDNCR